MTIDKHEALAALKNERQRAFVRNYVKHHNASRAAREAGYEEGPPTNGGLRGHELLQQDDVKLAIQLLEADVLNELGITEHYVLAGVVKEADTGDSSNARLQALKMLGQELGRFTDRKEVQFEGTVFTLDLGRELDAEEQE